MVLSVFKTQRRPWHPTPVLLPGKSHGQRSLVGCSPWGHEESDTTEWLHFHFSLSCIGEGNGNPLQCSCLENPRDGGAWWAALYGVAQSRTRLKWLSSSCIVGRRFTIWATREAQYLTKEYQNHKKRGFKAKQTQGWLGNYDLELNLMYWQIGLTMELWSLAESYVSTGHSAHRKHFGKHVSF